MGLIILLTFIAVLVAFATGIIVAVFDSSDNDIKIKEAIISALEEYDKNR